MGRGPDLGLQAAGSETAGCTLCSGQATDTVTDSVGLPALRALARAPRDRSPPSIRLQNRCCTYDVVIGGGAAPPPPVVGRRQRPAPLAGEPRSAMRPCGAPAHRSRSRGGLGGASAAWLRAGRASRSWRLVEQGAELPQPVPLDPETRHPLGLRLGWGGGRGVRLRCERDQGGGRIGMRLDGALGRRRRERLLSLGLARMLTRERRPADGGALHCRRGRRGGLGER